MEPPFATALLIIAEPLLRGDTVGRGSEVVIVLLEYEIAVERAKAADKAPGTAATAWRLLVNPGP